jgi:perosamine synthetase
MLAAKKKHPANSLALAVQGGHPIRSELLPYGKQCVDSDDIEAVNKVLRSDWLTTGPMVHEFEKLFAKTVGAEEAVAVSSGTAALHCAVAALHLQPGDEVVVSPLTFAATANAIVYEDGVPVFADVDPHTLLLDPQKVEAAITKKTKAILTVDYAGQPSAYDKLRQIANKHHLSLITDGCHALGATYHAQPVGAIADMTAFSFHPVKHITTGEGGMITTHSADLAKRMRTFRQHGITTDARTREHKGTYSYEMVELGYNYRLSDIQCALGINQLKKLPHWLCQRREIAGHYDHAFKDIPGVHPLGHAPHTTHAYHLYVVQLDLTAFHGTRDDFYAALRAEGIGVNVHYIPVHLHPYYKKRFGTKAGQFPIAEKAYDSILSLPIFPTMTKQDQEDVIAAVRKVSDHFRH